MNQIETLVAKLQLLAAKPSLSAAENAEAQALMQSLKAQGLSNEEISKASNGRWSMSSVKGYTTGIGAPSPNPWHDAVSALTDLIAANLSVDDVKAALAVFSDAWELASTAYVDDLNKVVDGIQGVLRLSGPAIKFAPTGQGGVYTNGITTLLNQYPRLLNINIF